MNSERQVRFEKRREELRKMSDAELKDLFWNLCDKTVEPLAKLSQTHTSPSIERSVLMRMGIDTITARAVVDACVEQGLLGKGAGHCVLKISQKQNLDTRAAAKKIVQDPGVLKNLFG